MKMVYIVPGTGQAFYCENCFRDYSLVSGLRAAGHEVTVVPLYLPVNQEGGASEGIGPLFFGAVRLYLEEKIPPLKRLPETFLRSLNAPPLLAFAASRAGSTRASGNEKLTLTMLDGENGNQAPEFERLADWIVKEVRPDAVIISNILLLGIASSIRVRSNISILCFAQDEDTWVNASATGYRDAIWAAIARHEESINRFLSLSKWYVNRVAPFVKIAPERFAVVPFGVNPDQYVASGHDNDLPVIGFLSRLNRANGFQMLVEAYRCLSKRENNGSVAGLSFCGGSTADDRIEIARCLKSAEGFGPLTVEKKFEHPDRARFLSSLAVLSVPGPEPIAFGTFIVEALAAGVPVVQPDFGGFSEIGEMTDSVIGYRPFTAESLADALASLCRDRARRKKLGKQGRDLVRSHFNYTNMAGRVIGVIETS